MWGARSRLTEGGLIAAPAHGPSQDLMGISAQGVATAGLCVFVYLSFLSLVLYLKALGTASGWVTCSHSAPASGAGIWVGSALQACSLLNGGSWCLGNT